MRVFVKGISPFLRHPNTSCGWEAGMAEEVFSLMMRQKEEALLLREKIQEQTSPPTDTPSDNTQDR